ncbi:T9SS type A sorting domain-containing protein, partial [Fulvivirga sp. RKSG066]|uniref:T9SS type A sorting domain-containing protein n=1 Tax=Fulvivirga aurantia TaxID=2529383 RepID=UPI0012BCA7BA
FLVAAFASQAQRFEVDEKSKNYKVKIGEKVSTPIKIKNISDQPINLVIRRVDQLIGSSQNTFFCWDGDCFESSKEQLPVQYQIPAGETSIKFETVLETGLAEGFSTVKYLIYERNNPAQAIEYNISYTIEDRKEKLLIYDSEDLKINDVYPNPVSEFAIVDYNVLNREIEAKILIHNVLGSVVGEYQLPPLENKVTIKTEDLNPGVYFYTLYIDNDGIMTRKLIIRK